MRGEARPTGGASVLVQSSGSGLQREYSAVVLVGGQGSRLRAVVDDRPKPLAEVHGRPFLAYLLDRIEAAGIREVVLACGYRAAQVEACFGARYRGLRLRYAVESEPLGTGGALRHALPLVRTPRLLVLNGDSICTADLAAFARDTVAEDCALVAVEVEDAREYGRLELDAEARVRRFVEKDGQGGAAWINAGIYSFNRARLAALPGRTPLSLEQEVLPAQADLRAWRSGAELLDIGTPERYAQAAAFLAGDCRGLLLLDRDGTLIEERHYLADPAGVKLLPGVGSALRRLRLAGYRLALATNQSGIGRGYFGAETLAAIHARMAALLLQEGVALDAILHCPHHPEEGCSCRKPRPGMLLQACSELGVAAAQSIVVGDKDCDVELARAGGAAAVLVRTGYGAATEAADRCDPDLCVDDLAALAEVLCGPGPGLGTAEPSVVLPQGRRPGVPQEVLT